MSKPLFYTNDMFKPTSNVKPPERKNPAERQAERKEKRRQAKRKLTLTGDAWKPGGHKYNEVNPEAIAVKHPSGLFDVYVDPPEKHILNHSENKHMCATVMSAEPALPSAQEYVTDEPVAKVLPEETSVIRSATFKRKSSK